MERQRKRLLTLFKIVFSLLLIYFVFTKIQFREVWEVMKQTKLHYLIGAIILFLISKCFASLRLNLYFHQIGIRLTQRSNAQLYLLGMFYNLFLPGGIGGDAYKGYVIRKTYEVPTKKVVATLLLDRLSGLLLLANYACILGIFLSAPELEGYKWLFGMGIIASLLFFWILNKRYFEYLYPIYWRSLGYSALVQLFQVICALFLLYSLDLEQDFLSYLFIFLVSSVVAVLPLTIGGIGSREVVFFYGALWLGLDESSSVSISILFFSINALVSFFGIYFHFRKPALKFTGSSLAERQDQN
ncbi:MAG: lysylphosphatidylglycerol synthase transmembrane domain-containing protein [Flavobacteriaceae bacterium]